MHNRSMRTFLVAFVFLLLAGFPGTAAVGQEPRVTGDQDGSSQQVEESDEAYRRRMELQDARYRDPTYTDPAGTWTRETEKIDKLPPESRDNIRDQLVDVIMANPDWKPGDALEDYPYTPTATAQADAELLEQEQAAWDEQIEKYHAREAEAFGAYRGQAAGPGNPSGASGGEGGQEGQQGGQSGAEGGGQDGGQDGQAENTPDSSDRNAATYQPQNGSQEDGPGNQGVSQSALDFLMARQQGQGQANGNADPGNAESRSQQQGSSGQPPAATQDPSQVASEQASSEQTTPNEPQQSEPDMRGIIAIEDLDKLEGTGRGVVVIPQPEEPEPEDPDDPSGRR